MGIINQICFRVLRLHSHTMAKDQKVFTALLNGIVRHDFFSETEITDDFLKSELYSELTEEDFASMALKSRKIINVLNYRSIIFLF